MKVRLLERSWASCFILMFSPPESFLWIILLSPAFWSCEERLQSLCHWHSHLPSPALTVLSAGLELFNKIKVLKEREEGDSPGLVSQMVGALSQPTEFRFHTLSGHIPRLQDQSQVGILEGVCASGN